MKLKAFCVIAAPVLAIGGPLLGPKVVHLRQSMLAPAHPMGAVAALATAEKRQVDLAVEVPLVASGPLTFTELQSGVEQGLLKAEFLGNGRDLVHATITNRSTAALEVQVEVGQMLEAGLSSVIIVRPAFAKLPPGKTAELTLQTAATRAGNRMLEQSYRLSYGRIPKLDPLLAYTKEHQELSLGAIQTAVLALTENLPLNAVAKFTPLAAELKSRFNTDAFRVDTFEIIAALNALREIGVADSAIAMTVDPQLRIEAMIEPLCRASAMRYYSITPQTEWEFWKKELLQGEPSTRHYALHGIARFYPDIALEMLPKWARESKTTPVFRLSAVQALADTQRPEALPLLRQLADELGENTELGRAAEGAAEYLGAHLANVAGKPSTVAFRSVPKLEKF